MPATTRTSALPCRPGPTPGKALRTSRSTSSCRAGRTPRVPIPTTLPAAAGAATTETPAPSRAMRPRSTWAGIAPRRDTPSSPPTTTATCSGRTSAAVSVPRVPWPPIAPATSMSMTRGRATPSIVWTPRRAPTTTSPARRAPSSRLTSSSWGRRRACASRMDASSLPSPKTRLRTRK